MKFLTIRLTVLMLAGVVVTGCLGGGDGTSAQRASINASAADGGFSLDQALGLLRDLAGMGEPEDVSSLTLNTSETQEPFDLPD
ncbi:MAG TPA: hypothetical protein VFV43_05030 [Limnobacter sp.]|nr:hypothetical protein [Limnobacter sp.]